MLEKTLETLQKQLENLDKTISSKYKDVDDFDLKLTRVDDEIK